MQQINPSTLTGPRAYFAGFEPRLITRLPNSLHKYGRDMERTLKILLLTKSSVIIGASHLRSTLAYDLFKKNPILLRESMIIPALRKDRNSIEALFEEESQLNNNIQEMIAFYNSNIPSVVLWELLDNVNWYQDKFIKDLSNYKSVIRKELSSLDETELKQIVNEIGGEKFFPDSIDDGKSSSKPVFLDRVLVVADRLEGREKKLLTDFGFLVYHLSGSRVVNSESILPQESYIDHRLIDLKEKNTVLTEREIFWKLFVEIAFESMQKQVLLPIESLDLITFEDIFHLRKPIEESKFRENYDSLIKKSLESVHKDSEQGLLFDAEQILQISSNISENFSKIFEKELKVLLKRKHRSNVQEVTKTGISFALGILGLVPVVGTIASTLGIMQTTPELFVNLSQSYKSMQAIRDYELYLKNKEQTLRDTIVQSDIKTLEKAPLLGIVDLLTATMSERLSLL